VRAAQCAHRLRTSPAKCFNKQQIDIDFDLTTVKALMGKKQPTIFRTSLDESEPCSRTTLLLGKNQNHVHVPGTTLLWGRTEQ
jgi:hypothetical protein